MRRVAARAWNSPTLMTWGSLGARMSGVVVVLPLVLRQFPVADVAVWQLFSSIFVLILLLDLGLSPTFSRMFAYALGGASIDRMADMRGGQSPLHDSPDTAAVTRTSARLFGALTWIYPRLAAGSTALFCVGGTAALWHPIAETSRPLHMWLAWAAVLAGSFMGMQGNAYAAALQGMNDIAMQRRVEIASGLGQALSSIIVLWWGGDVLALVLAYQAWTVINAMFNRALLHRLHPVLVGVKATRDAPVLRALWPATWRSGVGVLMSHGIIQASGLVYGQLVPAAMLSSYLLALRIMTMISQVSQAPFYSKLPRLGVLQARGDRAAQVELARRGMQLSQAVLAAGALAVAFLAQPLLRVLGSHTDFVEPRVWCLIVMAFFVERFGAMHLQLYSLTNHIVWHVANGVTGAAMIILAAALYPRLGVAALPTAMLAAYALMYSPYAARLSSRAFRFSLLAFEARVGLPIAGVLAAGLATRLLMS